MKRANTKKVALQQHDRVPTYFKGIASNLYEPINRVPNIALEWCYEECQLELVPQGRGGCQQGSHGVVPTSAAPKLKAQGHMKVN